MFELLRESDPSDCIRALGKKVRFVQTWGPDMKPLSGRRLNAVLEVAGLPSDLVKRR